MTREEMLAIAKPALFNTKMVRAILADLKTETRRLIKPRYKADEYGFQVVTDINGNFVRVEKLNEQGSAIFADGSERYVYPPFNYMAGDILYVRETFATLTNLAGEKRFVYKATDTYPFGEKYIAKFKWKPSIHMPKEAARIFLRVTDVRVEQLQDITIEQAQKEGCQGIFIGDGSVMGAGWQMTPIDEFSEIWDSTIPPAELSLYCWDADPFVWVIKFEKLEVFI